MLERSPTRFRMYRVVASGGCLGGGGGVNERVDVAYWIVTVETHRNNLPACFSLPTTDDSYTCPLSLEGEASQTLARISRPMTYRPRCFRLQVSYRRKRPVSRIFAVPASFFRMFASLERFLDEQNNSKQSIFH